MLQSILLSPGRIELRETPTPEPRDGELLVKVHAALTCGTDLKAFDRGHPMIPMPGPFGHEYAGVVARRGRGVRALREGDEVMGVHTAPCMKCPYCRKRAFNLCSEIMSTKAMGAFSEYILLPRHVVKHNVYKKPMTLPFEDAAMLEPLSCVVHGVGPLRVRPGENALLVGAGPIGLLHIILLRHRGLSVWACDPNQERRRAAAGVGAQGTCAPEDVKGLIDEATGGMGFDYVFECTGRPEVWESSIGHLRRGGALTLFGGCPKGTTVTYDTYRVHYDEITLRGVFHFMPRDVRQAYELIAGRKVNVKPLISGRYALSDLGQALGELKAGRGIKYSIAP